MGCPSNVPLSECPVTRTENESDPKDPLRVPTTASPNALTNLPVGTARAVMGMF